MSLHAGDRITAKSPGRQGGLSLIELMVSVALGMLLTLGVVTIYLDSKENYAVEEEMARMQENGRYALNLLKRELTLGGFFAGDLSIAEVGAVPVAVDCSTVGLDWVLDTTEPLDLVTDFDGTLPMLTVNNATLTCLPAAEIVVGTDILSVKRTASEPTLRDGVFRAGVVAADDPQWYLRVQDYGDFRAWSYIAAGADFPAADVGAGTVVDYWEVYNRIFFIRDHAAEDGLGNALDTIPTLCAQELVASSMTTQCLVEGVEDMQVEFGVDTDTNGVPDQFKNIPVAGDTGNSVTARVYLLIRSSEQIGDYTDTKTYQLGQKVVASPNDGFIRRVFTTTVQMRNAPLPTS